LSGPERPNPTVGQSRLGRIVPCVVLPCMTAALLLCVVLLTGQTAPATTTTTDELPVSLDRIQRALSTTPAIELKEQHPVFRLEVFGKKPTIEEILGDKFWLGPAPYGGMTHQEFMEKVTPQLAQPYAGFTGKYLIAETALTLTEQWALKQAIKKFRSAMTDHEREAARKEVLDALSDLERARVAAGLPPK
jgi:hypothetical protein